MQTIFKYPISMREDVVVHMPEEARIVHVGIDFTGQPCLWALVDPDKPATVGHRYGVYGTGGAVPDFKEYVGTWIERAFVWHVFREEVK